MSARLASVPIQTFASHRIDIARRLEADIERAAGQRLNFTLLVWGPGPLEQGEELDFSYISTLSREQTANLMAGIITKWKEANELSPPKQ